MPIFEYRCRDCGAGFESVALPGRKEQARCPQCGSAGLEKQFSAFATPGRSGAGAPGGGTCCGREERCDSPPCDEGGTCRRG